MYPLVQEHLVCGNIFHSTIDRSSSDHTGIKQELIIFFGGATPDPLVHVRLKQANRAFSVYISAMSDLSSTTESTDTLVVAMPYDCIYSINTMNDKERASIVRHIIEEYAVDYSILRLSGYCYGAICLLDFLRLSTPRQNPRNQKFYLDLICLPKNPAKVFFGVLLNDLLGLSKADTQIRLGACWPEPDTTSLSVLTGLALLTSSGLAVIMGYLAHLALGLPALATLALATKIRVSAQFCDLESCPPLSGQENWIQICRVMYMHNDVGISPDDALWTFGKIRKIMGPSARVIQFEGITPYGHNLQDEKSLQSVSIIHDTTSAQVKSFAHCTLPHLS